jgi:NAD(P)-dependent dehydrogenase (short-subunit alcohol dehydrogenase family)
MSTNDVLQRLFDVRDLRAIVTGAASGLGYAMAEVLADCGARVTLADVDAAVLEQSTQKLVDRGCAARSHVVDVSDEQQVQALVDDTVAAEGQLDVVFANAGISGGPGFGVDGGTTLDGLAREDWSRTLGVNLDGVFFTIKHAARVMKPRRSGRIVATSSIAGLQAEPFVGYGYIASKAAIVNMVRQAALELAPHGVTVNAICPGPFKGTRIGGGATVDPDPETERRWGETIPVGRMAEPEELKGLVLLLASRASGFITGHAHVIDGGSLIGKSA